MRMRGVRMWALLWALCMLPWGGAQTEAPARDPEIAFNTVYRRIIESFVDGATSEDLLGAAYARLVHDITPPLPLTRFVPAGTPELTLLTLRRVINEVSRNYRRDEPIRDLFRDAEEGMVESLGDPFSTLLLPESNERMREMMRGDFAEISGIGVYLDERDGRVLILSALRDMPAFRIGIRSGDVIVSVSGEAIHTLDDARAKMRGPVGSWVELTVQREGVPEPLMFRVTREPVAPRNVQYHMLDDEVGYVRLSTFLHTGSAHDLETGLNYLRINHDARRIILDLRGNPGGLLDQAVDVAGLFLRNHRLVVSTRGREAVNTSEFRVSRNSPFQTMPLVVLVDGGSASASEIVAGAIKDQGRGDLVGTKTYGKGSVQEIYQLGDGDALKLTIAKYYTPRGICIHGTGIEPDVPVALDEKTLLASSEPYRQLMAALPHSLKNARVRDATAEEQRGRIVEKVLGHLSPTQRELAMDPQLARALETVKTLEAPGVLGGIR